MIVFLIAAILASAVGLLRGGSLKTLGETQFSWVWLIFLGLGLQLAADFAPSLFEGSAGTAVVILANVPIVVFLVLNRRLPGTALIGAGLILNVLVIGLNGAMPVSERASDIAGYDIGDGTDIGVEHELLNDDSVLPWLTDVIPLPSTQIVLSVGDLILGSGVALLVYRRTTAVGDRGSAAKRPAASD